jgi:hypothetical protein
MPRSNKKGTSKGVPVAPANPFWRPTELASPPSRLMTEPEFCEVYSAARFAQEWLLYLDTKVTITWEMLGLMDETAVSEGWTAFRKCLTAWMTERRLPTVFIYAHERGRKRGLHSHVAVFVPPNDLWPGLRREFRSWVLAWAKRTAGRRVPKSTRVRDDGGRPSVIYHWRHVHYLCKGFDKSAVVVPASGAEDGQTIHLGDLIAFAWRDPGYIEMKRVGVSQSLGFSRRRMKGYPECAAWNCEQPSLADLALSMNGVAAAQVPSTPSFSINYGSTPGNLASEVCAPWLSPYEYGVRRVEGLYPAEFVEVVEVGYPTAKELRARKRDAAHAGREEVEGVGEWTEEKIAAELQSLEI